MIWGNREAVFTYVSLGALRGYPPQRGERKSRRLWSVGEASPFLFFY
jgi:hypothetical protein